MASNEIKWYKNVKKTTILDALGTYNLLVKSPNMDLLDFSKLCKNGKYTDISVKQYLKLKPLNAGLFRFEAEKPEDAYKINPNKTHNDYESLMFLINTNKYVSPIILLHTKIDNKKCYVKLDGVHRTLAAKFRNSKIRMLVIEVPSIEYK